MPDLVLKPRRTLAAIWLTAALLVWAAMAALIVWALVGMFGDDPAVSLRIMGRIIYPVIFLASLGSGAFWKFWKARKDRFVLDDEGVIMRRDHDTRLYWREINEVQLDSAARRCLLVTTVGNYSFDHFDCADPAAAARLIAQRKGLEVKDQPKP